MLHSISVRYKLSISLLLPSTEFFLSMAYILVVNKHNFYIWFDQSSVTGEHTCMLLKPLNNDEFEVSESDELGFFAPFYKGFVDSLQELDFCVSSKYTVLGLMLWPLLFFCSDFRIRFSKLLSDKFKKMDYKLAMR